MYLARWLTLYSAALLPTLTHFLRDRVNPNPTLVCVARYVIIWLCVAEHMHMYLYMGHEPCCCLVYLSLDFVHSRGQALHIDYHRFT